MSFHINIFLDNLIVKKQFVFSFVILLFGISFSVAQTTAIPNDNFEDYLETHDENGAVVNVGDATSMGDGIAGNNAVTTTSISNVLSLNVSNLNISDLTGIQGFASLETLICSGNNLTSIDVSSNTNLKSLLCGSNLLTVLQLENNPDLETLNCSNNQIQNLNLVDPGTQTPYNPLLKSLTCSSNQLTSIDVSKHNDLNLLNVSKNRLTGELIVSNNLDLENLFCASNQVTILNLSANTVLKNLDVSNNLISNLDLSTINTRACPDPQTNPLTICQGTSNINVSNNPLTNLNIANGFNDLISIFNSEDNPDLFCIQIDSGFSVPTGWTKDDWTYFGDTICTDELTYVPDDNFETYLETHDENGVVVPLGDANSMGDGVADNNFVTTTKIENVLALNVQSNNIDVLTGIEDFIALRTLDCSNNQLQHLDVSNNGDLTGLNCSNNTLPTLDISSNIGLITLNCSGNTLANLELNTNTALVTLNCSSNVLSNLDLSANTLLDNVDCSFNQIENLNVTTNTALVSFLCNDNTLLALNVKNGTNVSRLNTFNATNNVDLVCIEVDNVTFSDNNLGWQKDNGTATYNLNCGTYVPDDNFEDYLETHDANGAIVALGDVASMGDGIANNNFVTTNKIRTVLGLDVQRLGISDLTGIQDFIDLQDLNCSNNALTTLNLNTNTALQTLDCSTNQIENLNVVPNIALETVICNGNRLLTLNVKNGTNNGLLTTFNATNNPSLFCINVDDTTYSENEAGWQKDDTIATYSTDCELNRFTAIPDDFFEQALIDLGLDSGPLDNQVLTANIEHVLVLNVNNKQIEDLEGIKGFSLLRELDCSNNYLNDLDVSDMVNLEALYCSSNYFLTNNTANTNGLLNTTGTSNLRKLFCASNNLGDLDTSLNVNLEALDCADNNLDVLNVTGNSLLKELNCSNNNLTGLDISTNVTLEDVNCDSNKISNLNTATLNNTTLVKISCASNDLSTLLIGNYVALVDLNCRSNSLTQLITGANVALEFLDFTDNQISDIILTTNTNLVQLLAAQNELTQLNIGTNTLLESLDCSYNQINQLLVNSALSLRYLSSANNQLTDLDLSNNLDLIDVNVSSNSLSGLQLSNNLNQLKSFNCSSNMLDDGIDLSTMGTGTCPTATPNIQAICPTNITINVSNNQLEFLNIQNGVNNRILNFNATLNANLSCIQVDDVNAIGASWKKDATSEYSMDCRFGETYVPDDNFEQALITLGYDVGPLNDYVPTANIEILTVLDVSGNNILDLTGIEDFEALLNLNVSNNALTTLDLSKHVDLTTLDVSNNSLSDLDLSDNTALITINCSDNLLTTLDLTANINVTNLNIANNNFSEFVPSNIPSLQIFNCDSNQIIDLDFTMNTGLTSLSCALNELESLNIKNGQNPSLTNLNAQNNVDLTCIQTDTGAVPGGVTWIKDATTQYAINCRFGETYVPDDAFETALINFGYDTGALDDYVPTRTISNISFLDISEKGISDLTGIEDFTSLTILNVEENDIATVDLNANVLLVSLNASNNVLTTIDLMALTDLRVLNISNNDLSQININSNLSLRELNVSSNALTALDVNVLVDLEKLNCSSNLLDALNVTSNTKLIELFCQSNLFIQDRLNLQNGANATLKRFSATNNPDLRCILVDNPFEVISNAGGTYDNWFKDISASYQSICSDADNDGIANVDDLCPNTPFGEPVDLFGCPFLSLPNDNFTVLITGETCLNNNDGKVNITTKELYNYKANLTKDGFDRDYNFTNEIDIKNLLAGMYRLCITVEEWPNYLRCYDVIINHPENLEVITGKRSTGKEVSFEMSGNSSYNVDFNGFKYTTNDSKITLQLEEGSNSIKISTDLKCQGIHEETIFISDSMFVYPNPFQNDVNIYLGDAEENIEVNMYSYLGQLVYSKKVENRKSRRLNIDTNRFASGLYTVFIQSKKSVSTFKIVKK
ncbi:T9SS type A sorting domain-containing protein [Flavivirga amylovorans]|uniref:T9SS type A sorting domain-containing protein n=1 Tax=Flavivirga amylovorans TaxID=870486 RepID=A0ABT8X3Z3_9FLAO|nr:T9SS type A sorting domain-containing protein [Flavivirga amylovorans]MDO5988640.1 T9SS type A sorting domain-containing protein [Flavivirga amylovorans]